MSGERVADMRDFIHCLEQIAALASQLPGGRRSMHLGVSEAAVEALRALPGARVTRAVHALDPPQTIESVYVLVGGVEVAAQRSFVPTPDEQAALRDHPVRHESVVARLGDAR